jgi:hypothetical protein
MAETIEEETKREGQRKAKRCTNPRNQEKGRERELVPLVVGSNLTQGLHTLLYTLGTYFAHFQSTCISKGKKGWFGA